MPFRPQPAMLMTSIHRPAVSLLLCEAQPRTPWVWAGLVMATIVALPQTAQAQTLMDVTGATAIQGTLNNINLVPASGTIQKARDASAAAEASLNQRSSGLPAPGGSLPLR